jgi:hypothetical protein
MNQEEIEKTDNQPDPLPDKSDFIQDFIDRKRLQNRVLQEIIDKITQVDHGNESETTTNNQNI